MPTPWGGRHPAARLPAPFTGARRQLVAWNIGVLCAILLVVAAGVYISQSRAVADQVDAQLISQARRELSGGHAAEDLREAEVAPAADGIARAHGGVLTVRSELGAGTTFRLALPAA